MLHSEFLGGSRFTPGVNKSNSTRGTCLELSFASPQLVWRKTTVFLRKYATRPGTRSKWEDWNSLCLWKQSATSNTKQRKRKERSHLLEEISMFLNTWWRPWLWQNISSFPGHLHDQLKSVHQEPCCQSCRVWEGASCFFSRARGFFAYHTGRQYFESLQRVLFWFSHNSYKI